MELIHVIGSCNFYEAKNGEHFMRTLEFQNWLRNTSKYMWGRGNLFTSQIFSILV